MPYNILTCAGWITEGSAGLNFTSGCASGRLGMVILFFIIAIMRKWIGEEAGFDFNFLISLVAGLLGYLFVVSISGSFKAAMVVGIVLSLVGGLGGAMFFGGDSE